MSAKQFIILWNELNSEINKFSPKGKGKTRYLKHSHNFQGITYELEIPLCCPRKDCGSYNVIKMGTFKRGKIRIQKLICKTCNKDFYPHTCKYFKTEIGDFKRSLIFSLRYTDASKLNII